MLIKGDTRSLDYSSYRDPIMIAIILPGHYLSVKT